MKVVRTILALIIIGFVVFFVIENSNLIELGLLGNKMTLPVSVIVIGFYILGAISGALIFKTLKRGLKKEND